MHSRSSTGHVLIHKDSQGWYPPRIRNNGQGLPRPGPVTACIPWQATSPNFRASKVEVAGMQERLKQELITIKLTGSFETDSERMLTHVNRTVHLTWEADKRRSSKDNAEGKGQAMQQKLFIETSVLQKREKLRYKAVVPREAVKRTPRKEPVKWEALEQDAKIGRQKDKVEGPRNPWL